jgi:hypothetical protein
MTTPSPSSPTEATQKTTDLLEQLTATLREKGVEVERLAVLSVGSDQIIGEIDYAESKQLTGRSVLVKNPKRLIRLQRMEGQSLSIDFLIGDLDFVSSGAVQVSPVYSYRINDINEESQTAMLGLLVMYFENRARNRAQAAGIQLPGPTRSLLK